MSRFIAPDLSRLPNLPLEKPDFETILNARLNDFQSRAEAAGQDYNVGMIEGDPIVIDQRVGADREVEVRADHNDKVKAVLLASAWGPYLDHIAATYFGISRLVLETDPESGEVIAWESDQDFRLRIALAPEAWSTAGPEGAYIFHALELDGERDLVDAACYSEEDGATYTDGRYHDAYTEGSIAGPFANRADGDPVIAPEVLIVILPLQHKPTQEEWAELLKRTWRAVTRKEVRPIGDNVRVEPVKITEYQIEAEVTFAPGADPALVIANATKGVEEYVADRRRISAKVQRVGIGAAMQVADVNDINLIEPAADIHPGSKGAAQCTGITITAVEGDATWRATP